MLFVFKGIALPFLQSYSFNFFMIFFFFASCTKEESWCFLKAEPQVRATELEGWRTNVPTNKQGRGGGGRPGCCSVQPTHLIPHTTTPKKKPTIVLTTGIPWGRLVPKLNHTRNTAPPKSQNLTTPSFIRTQHLKIPLCILQLLCCLLEQPTEGAAWHGEVPGMLRDEHWH